MQDFFSFQNIFSSKSDFFSTKPRSSNDWEKIGEKTTLAIFKSAAARVPAYKDFLLKNSVNPDSVTKLSDFHKVPPISKENYLYEYPHEALLWDGKSSKPMTFHSTSGSTGEPTYFQREYKFDLQREEILTNFFQRNRITVESPTLFIVLFGMGVWSAGLGIYTGAYLSTNRHGFPISIISPGVNKTEAIKVLSKLAPSFKQVIIAGYPPFLKDVLDEATQKNIDIKSMNLRYIFTGESLSEEFRDHVADLGGVTNVLVDTMNTYGTSELGPTAIETPLSILTSRTARKNKELFSNMYGETSLWPTLAQFDTRRVNIHEHEGELYFTGDNSIPLIRYKSGDKGGVLSYSKLKKTFTDTKINLEESVQKEEITEFSTEQPFVYVFARKNLALTLYGVLIYPEYIKRIILKSYLEQFLTGKFTMTKKYSANQDQYLEINLELKKGMKPSKDYEKMCLTEIVAGLKKQSSEFKELNRDLKNKSHPSIKLWNYEDPKYFTPGIKQKWITKD